MKMSKYIFENGRSQVEVPEHIQKRIILDYVKGTFYWSVGILSFLVGFILGITV